jgi:hypothetical protein
MFVRTTVQVFQTNKYQEHHVALQILSLAPLVNALPAISNAKLSWGPIHKEMTLMLVPRVDAKSPAPLPNLGLMFATPCSRIFLMAPRAKAAGNVITANVRVPALEKRLRAGYRKTRH